MPSKSHTGWYINTTLIRLFLLTKNTKIRSTPFVSHLTVWNKPQGSAWNNTTTGYIDKKAVYCNFNILFSFLNRQKLARSKGCFQWGPTDAAVIKRGMLHVHLHLLSTPGYFNVLKHCFWLCYWKSRSNLYQGSSCVVSGGDNITWKRSYFPPSHLLKGRCQNSPQ